MRAYYGSRISEHMTKTPEGYLICLGVPIARIGKQRYLATELGIQDSAADAIHNVYRVEDEVFSQATLASFEGKPVTNDHPMESVDTSNVSAYSCGHVQNVRRGVGKDSDLLIADLFITDKRLIDDIQNGRREVSCGYDCEYSEDEDGKIYQRAIRGNHVAVVENGRAGHRVAIKDSVESLKTRRESPKMKDRHNSLFARIFSHAVKDMEPEEIEDAVEEMAATAAEATQEDAAPEFDPNALPAQDEGNDLAAILAKLQELEQKVAALESKAADAEPDPLKQLEDELTVGEKPVQPEQGVPTKPMDEDPEEAVTIPAEELGKDKACTDEEEEEENKGAALAALNAVKPVIASLPANQRKEASDRAVREIRKLMGRDSKPATNGYATIASNMTTAAKNRKTQDEGELGKSIMASRNPHYKNA